jgi:hypothetical protein
VNFDVRDFSRVELGLTPAMQCCAGSGKLASRIDGNINARIERYSELRNELYPTAAI